MAENREGIMDIVKNITEKTWYHG